MKKKRGKSNSKLSKNYKSKNNYSSLFLIAGLTLSLLIIAGVLVIAINSSPNLTGNSVTGMATSQVVEDTANFFKNLIDGIQKIGGPIFNALLGATDSGSVTFSKILVFLLVMFIIMGALDFAGVAMFAGPDKVWLRFVVGSIVSILGVRFLPNDLVTQLAFPSGALVAGITIVLPFIIYFIFVQQSIKGTTFKRIAWTPFAIVMFVLWVNNWNEKWWYLYPCILGASLAIIIFQAWIDAFWRKGLSRAALDAFGQSQKAHLLQEMNAQQTLITTPGQTPAQVAAARKELDRLTKEFARLRRY